MATYPEILIDAGATLAQALERQGLAPEKAEAIAWETTEQLRRRWGGMDHLYIPKAAVLDLEPKYQALYERWHAGEPIALLARIMTSAGF